MEGSGWRGLGIFDVPLPLLPLLIVDAGHRPHFSSAGGLELTSGGIRLKKKNKRRQHADLEFLPNPFIILHKP